MTAKIIDGTMPDFADMILEKKIYIDKTEYIWNLIHGVKYNFIARPRRFGKSLLLSTLKALFLGKKDLFSGLAIAGKDYDWKVYPVIHLDFGKVGSKSVEMMESDINELLDVNAENYGIKLVGETPKRRFAYLLRKLAARERVSILIDEYDHPILEHIKQPDLHDYIAFFRDFYSLIKAESAGIRFVMICGVSNIALSSFYSSFNNPKDLTRQPEYATLFGFTQNELERYFADDIVAAAAALHVSVQTVRDRIKFWYDGYRFEENAESVYNPVSIANFFTSGYKFANYWIRTGTPCYLVECMREANYDIDAERACFFGEEIFYPIDPEMSLPITRLLFQCGYLTIKSAEYDPEIQNTAFTLDYPNREVEISFHQLSLNLRAGLEDEAIGKIAQMLPRSLQTCDMNMLRTTLMTFFSKLKFGMIKDAKREGYFEIAFSSLLTVLNDFLETEYQTNSGIIDAFVKTKNYIYLFEFKIDRSAEIALDQIRRKEYYRQFSLEDRQVMLIGINFNTATRQIDGWKVEPYPAKQL